MALKSKKKNLADKINALISTAPANFGSDDEPDETRAKVVEHEDSDNSEEDFGQSKIRKQNIDLLDQIDKRYAGKKVSRKRAYEESENSSDLEDSDEEVESTEQGSENAFTDEEDGSENGGEEDEDNQEEDEQSNSEMDEDKNEDGSSINSEAHSENSEDQSESEEEDGYDVDIGNPLYRPRDKDTNFKTMSNTNLRADIDKGNCVRSQLKIWENLLEMRIKFQKCLVMSNRMPQFDVHKNYRTDTEFMKKTNEVKDKLSMLLSKMLDLQGVLLKQYPETNNITSKKSELHENKNGVADVEDSMDEEIPSDTEDEHENKDAEDSDKEDKDESVPSKKLKLSGYGKVLDENHKSYSSYRDSVIQKWNEKTRIISQNTSRNAVLTTLKQIEFAMSDKPKLRKRTQLKRSEYDVIGKASVEEDQDGRRVQEYDTEIYDDDDFYHQLLRDLIEYKSSGVTDPVQLSTQWIKLQNMRSTLKRKIDTRATKGRRIRYNVHNKLVNFMAPITVYDTWTDLAKNELYNSLFGKIKPVEGEVGQ